MQTMTISVNFIPTYWELIEVFRFRYKQECSGSIMGTQKSEITRNQKSPKVGLPACLTTRPHFCLFSFFSNTNFTEKNVGLSGIRTRIVEGKHADHLTTTTTTAQSYLSNFFKLFRKTKESNSIRAVVQS